MSVRNRTITLFFLLVLWSSRLLAKVPLPIVLWHAGGFTCCDPEKLGAIIVTLQNAIPGVYVYSVQQGATPVEEIRNSYFIGFDDQVSEMCKRLFQNEALRNGYNAVGFAQGARTFFRRGIAQRCPHPPIRTLITLGTPNQGLFNLSSVHGVPIAAAFFRSILFEYSYTKLFQQHFTLAGMWHDPFQEEVYRTRSLFLADINNERFINTQYRSNLKRLQKLVLVQFEQDFWVLPKDSQWFGFYKPNQTTEIIPLEKSRLYIEDRLGLREMIKQHQVDFISHPGLHLDFTQEWFIENIVNKYLV